MASCSTLALLAATLSFVAAQVTFTPLAIGQAVNGSLLEEQSQFFIVSGVPMDGSNLRITLTSLTGDADLYGTSIQPLPTDVNIHSNAQLESEAGPNLVDTFEWSPMMPEWSPAGGPYYIEVYGYSAATWILEATLSAASPTPTSPVTPSLSPTAVPSGGTPAPVPGTLLPLTMGAPPFRFVSMRFQSSLFFAVTVTAAGQLYGFRVELQPDGGTNADLYVSAVAPTGAAFAYQAGLQSTFGVGQLDVVSFGPSAAPGAVYYIEVYAPLGSPSFTLAVLPQLPPSPTPTPTPPNTGTPSPSGTNIPLPAPGTVVPLALNTEINFPFLTTGASIFYSVAVSPDTAPLGFQVLLRPAMGTNADLYVSANPPVGPVFTYQVGLQSMANALGGLDLVAVTPATAGWAPGGGTFFIEVFGTLGTPSFTLLARPIMAASPVPTISPSAPPSALFTAAGTPVASVGATLPLVFGQPSYFYGLPAGQSNVYTVAVPPSPSGAGFTVQLQNTVGGNVQLYLSSLAPAGGLFTYQGAAMQSLVLGNQGVLNQVTLQPGAPFFQVAGGTYWVEAFCNAGTGSYSLTVLEASPSPSALPTPSTSLSRTPLPTAITPLPTPGFVAPLGLNATAQFVDLVQGGWLWYAVTVTPETAPWGLLFTLTSGPGMNADLYVSVLPPAAPSPGSPDSGFAYMPGFTMQSATALAVDSVTLLPSSPFFQRGASSTYYIEVWGASLVPASIALVVEPLGPSPSNSPTPSNTPSNSPIMTALSPVPTPLSISPMVLGAPTLQRAMPPNRAVWYSLFLPIAAVPFGFTVTMTPVAGSNTDLFVSNSPPVNGAFVYQLQNLALPGQPETVTVLPTIFQWRGEDTTWYFEVWSNAGISAFSLVVVPLSATPTPTPSSTPLTASPVPTGSISPSIDMTAANTPAPLPGSPPLPLVFGTPFYFRVLPFQNSIFFAVTIPAGAAIPFGIAVRLQTNPPLANADLYVSTFPPNGNGVMFAQAQSTLPGAVLDQVVVAPGSSPLWQALPSTLYIEVYAAQNAPTFSLVVLPLEAPTPSNNATNSPAATPTTSPSTSPTQGAPGEGEGAPSGGAGAGSSANLGTELGVGLGIAGAVALVVGGIAYAAHASGRSTSKTRATSGGVLRPVSQDRQRLAGAEGGLEGDNGGAAPSTSSPVGEWGASAPADSGLTPGQWQARSAARSHALPATSSSSGGEQGGASEEGAEHKGSGGRAGRRGGAAATGGSSVSFVNPVHQQQQLQQQQL